MAVFPTRILLATDGSPDALTAALSAVELCGATGSELHVVHVGEFVPTYLAFTDQEPAELRQHARETLDAQTGIIEGELGGTVAEAHLLLGRPAEEIIDLSERIDAGTVIVGSRGQGRLRRAVLGSVSENVVRYAPCPVFVARSKDG